MAPSVRDAGDSRHSNEWAAHRYRQLRAAGKRHPHAERILARTWAQIIWRCWQDHTPYDPARHGGLLRLQNKRLDIGLLKSDEPASPLRAGRTFVSVRPGRRSTSKVGRLARCSSEALGSAASSHPDGDFLY